MADAVVVQPTTGALDSINLLRVLDWVVNVGKDARLAAATHDELRVTYVGDVERVADDGGRHCCRTILQLLSRCLLEELFLGLQHG